MAICEQCQQVVNVLGDGGVFRLPDGSLVVVKDGMYSPYTQSDGTHYSVIADKKGPYMKEDQPISLEQIFFNIRYNPFPAHLLLGLNRIE